MNAIFPLTGWNFYMARRPLGAVLGGMLLAETALALFCTSRPALCTLSQSTLYGDCGGPVLFLVAYLGALWASLRPLTMTGGRSRVGCTLLTLPMPRWQILLAQVLSSVLALAAVIACQLLWMVLIYWPTTALQTMVANANDLGQLVEERSLWWELAANPVLNLLLPWQGGAVWRLPLFLLAPALIASGVPLHRGAARVGAICLAVAGALLCLALAAVYVAKQGYDAGDLWMAGAVSLLSVVSWFWSLYALHRAAPIQ